MSRRHAGFTLIEVLAAVLLTSIVVGAVSAFFIQFSRGSERAMALTRHGRHTIVALDRVVHDLEGATLLLPDPVEPELTQGWAFFAQERYVSNAADTIHFVTSNRIPRAIDEDISNIATISYFLEPDDHGTYVLLRRAVAGADASTLALAADASGALTEEASIVAQGVLHFGARFLSSEGEWLTSWDSSLTGDVNALPQAVEVQLALAPDEALERGDDVEADLLETALEGVAIRRVVLPVRPLDLRAMIENPEQGAAAQIGDEDLASGDEADDESDGDTDDLAGMTVGECLGRPGVLASIPEEYRRIAESLLSFEPDTPIANLPIPGIDVGALCR